MEYRLSLPWPHRQERSVFSGHMTARQTASGGPNQRKGDRWLKGVACCLGDRKHTVTSTLREQIRTQ